MLSGSERNPLSERLKVPPRGHQNLFQLNTFGIHTFYGTSRIPSKLPVNCSQVGLVMSYIIAQIRATIARFYMITQTSLSAATRTQWDKSVQNSSFQPQPLVYPETRRALIHPRNPFLVMSNSPLVTRRSPLITALLIYGSAIKTHRNQFKNSNLQISNRRQTGGLRTHEPQVSSQLGSNRIAFGVESRGPQEEVA